MSSILGDLHRSDSDADHPRDIKPHNFLVFPGSRLKLTDFGTAARQADEHRLREVSAYHQPLPLDQCLIAVGTPDYIAPEVLEMAEDATMHEIARQTVPDTKKLCDPLADRNLEGLPGYGTGADWWSYGSTLYELVYGTAPFLTPSIKETYERIMRCSVSPHATNADRTRSLCRLPIALLSTESK